MAHPHLALYENVAEITGAMAHAARSSDWDQLVALEQTCAGHVERLMQDPAPELSHDERARKAGLIRQILEHDRDIRDRVAPWMNRLASLIGSVRNERKLAGAYHT